MKSNVLDQPIWDNKELIQILQRKGYHRVYETQKGKIIVEKSTQVKVSINTQDQLAIKPVFPEIGNAFQILSTVILAILFSYLGVPFGLFVAIAVGQVLSYWYHLPKSRALQTEIQNIIAEQKH